MFSKLFSTGIMLVWMVGCGTTTTNDNQHNRNDTPSSTKQTTPSETLKKSFSCNVSLETDRDFQDRYVDRHVADIPWPQAKKYKPLSVTEIEQIFTTARLKDPTVSKPMILPPQHIWDSMQSAEKVLYLVNKARCDRGIKPYEGLDPTINSIAQSYAQFLSQHPDLYKQNPHEADGKTPFERMQQEGGVRVGDNADFFQYGENIATFAVGTSSSNYPTVYESEAKAVYGWLYEDVKGQARPYGHRQFLLANKLIENAGEVGAEGLIGIGTALRQYYEAGYYWSEEVIVMDGFDPNKTWDNNLASTQRVTLYQ